ncbi:adenylosuccinate synthase [Halomontanus rarus]|uniref:adenylosuccinate synthase n=1 Tax=Halomontanus rarus TaxID=3034020 RepID=UPI0023E8F018|nr:adenylosuccinate synthase [Halovivax sp. TS33]
MNATVVGSQLGDEGKGGVVDLFSEDADVVVRYQGGNNAGHTVVHRGEEYKLRLVPSGVIRGKTGVLGNGCVLDLETLFDEIETLRARGLDPDVRVSARAHIVLPYHRVLDRAEEASKTDGGLEVGTTGNGIGPAYEDKAGRRGIRVGELLDDAVLRDRLEYAVPKKRRLARDVFGIDTGVEFDVDRLFETFRGFGDRLESEEMVVDAGAVLAEMDRDGANVLFESAQGTHIDVDHGNYPFVTSSNPTAGGAITGTGVDPSAVADGRIIGVVKAYLSRVGSGPMPTELSEDAASAVRERVGGFGTVTGRPRRIGWLDVPMLRHAARVNGFTGIVLNHVDALGGFEELKVCETYELDGETLTGIPSTTAEWGRCTPEYRTFETWADRDWSEIRNDGYDALPDAARTYVEYVSAELGVPVYAVGIGPGRDETIVRQHPFGSAED